MNANVGGVDRKTTQEPGQDRAWYCESEGYGKEEEVREWDGVVAALCVEMDKRRGGTARHVSTSKTDLFAYSGAYALLRISSLPLRVDSSGLLCGRAL